MTGDRIGAGAGARHVTMPVELLSHPHLPDRAKLLYLVLQSHLGSAGAIFPKRSTLAGAMGCSEDSIDRAIRELVEWGYLDVIHRVRLADGTHFIAGEEPPGAKVYPGSNMYVLLPPPEAREAQEPSRRLAATPGRTDAGTGSRTRAARSGVPEPPGGIRSGRTPAATPSESEPGGARGRTSRPTPVDPLAGERAAAPRRRRESAVHVAEFDERGSLGVRSLGVTEPEFNARGGAR